ncbi:methyltransferase domain-containing protein [Methylobacterium sp. 17Sr1-1]|uniref:class I SAM-dependent methyltransferase n=1 Tax=Methylobacterium sp. 17Sr1-1 TaxID=2202826 RepID=UPI0013A56B7F|nr:methyltransferase domain-containing protein [Methylobacterium sp. 17Sr1-1]
MLRTKAMNKFVKAIKTGLGREEARPGRGLTGNPRGGEVLDPEVKIFKEDIISALEANSNRPSFRGGFYSFYQINQLLRLSAKHPGIIRNKRILDFGCGATRPVAASIILYLLGARSTMAIDLEAPFDPGGIAVAEYGNILSVISGLSQIELHHANADLSLCRSRAAEFDLSALLGGDLRSGLAPDVGYKLSRYQDLSEAERKFDLMISNSVFEHVADLEDVLTCARRSISPDGYIFAGVDFRDHRWYSDASKWSFWQYLIDDGDHEPGYINKIRYSAMNELIRRSGFRIQEAHPVRDEMSPEFEAGLLPKYRTLSQEDKETTECLYLLRPA